MLTKSQVLWKSVNVRFFPSHTSQTSVAKSFINGLPTFVTSIRLQFMEKNRWKGTLDFGALCKKLLEKCSDIEKLILVNSEISNSLPSVIDVCTQWLQNVKNLIFHHSTFCCDCSTGEGFAVSKIEILELFDCHFDCSNKPSFSKIPHLEQFNRPPFSKMPHLKQLHLFETFVHLHSWFEDDVSFVNQLHVLDVGSKFRKYIDYSTLRIFSAICNNGHNMKELYLCNCCVPKHDLTFTESAFLHLKTICLFRSGVTVAGVVSLIQSCPSLENVYVHESVAQSFAAHPFVVANRCKAGIVKTIFGHCNHNANDLCN